MRHHDPDVLETCNDSKDHPGDKKTVVPQIATKDEAESKEDSKRSIKDRVLDERADADVFSFALFPFCVNFPC